MTKRTCSMGACDRPAYCRGWCTMHYQRWRVTGDPEATKQAPGETWGVACIVDGCTARRRGRGYCNKHYRRVLKFGDPSVSKIDRDHDGHCKLEGCERGYCSGGYCSMHWQRFKATGDPGNVEAVWRLWPPGCSAPGCIRPHASWGYCAVHVQSIVYNPRRRTAVDEIVRVEVVAERDGWLCGLCKEAIDPALAWPASRSKSLDHIKPVRHGGRHSYSNIQLAHLDCNIRKRDKIIN